MLSGRHRAHAEALRDVLPLDISAYKVPDRLDRLEPRRRKRRPKNYSLLQKPALFTAHKEAPMPVGFMPF